MEKILQKLVDIVSKMYEKMQGAEKASDSFVYVTTTLPIQPIIQRCTYRRDIVLTAPLTNTDIVYFSFLNTVSSTQNFIYLNAGENFCLNDFRGEIFALAASGSQTINYGEW